VTQFVVEGNSLWCFAIIAIALVTAENMKAVWIASHTLWYIFIQSTIDILKVKDNAQFV
jgi:hypothetical protein